MLNIKNAFLAMILIVTASNVLVQFPINHWLTWAAIIYPISFLITELTNLQFGPKAARRVVYAGFTVAVILSYCLATPKIAVASGSAFLISQLLDIYIFNRLRQRTWWQAPLCASVLASLVDATIFWNLAFFGESIPLLTLATGDTIFKILVDISMLTPFRLVIRRKSFLARLRA